MTMQDIVQIILNNVDKYATESEEDIVVGTKPKRTHKKKRIAKKWAKRYGVVPVIERKKCKKVDVTLDLIVDVCKEHNLSLPDEILAMTIQNDCGEESHG